MADFSLGISKIYQFIGNDVQRMDLDGNGQIIEAECRYFLKDNINQGNIFLENGENVNDLISAFWKKINSNRAGKSIVSLDSKEIDAMNKRIELYEKFEEYFDNNIITQLSSNKYITDSDSREQWIKSVKESLLNYVDKFIQRGGTADKLEAYLNGQLENSFYEDPTRKNLAKLAMNKTTANIYAQNYIKEQIGDVGREFSDLQKMIDKLITTEIGDTEMTDSVIEKVKFLVDDYLATASGYYEFSDKEKKEALNEYQAYVLTNKLQEVMKEIEKDEDYADNKELYDSAITKYINDLVSNAKKGDFNELIKLDYNTIINSAEFQEIKAQIANNKIIALRQEVISYCKTQYSKGGGYKDAVDKVFGSQYEDVINSLEYDELNKKYKELQELIGKIVSVPDNSNSIYNSIPDAVKTGSSKFTFYVDKSGAPVFVIYDEAKYDGVFDNTNQKNTGLQERFNKVKTSLENGYSESITALDLTSEEKTNLFNAALFMTLSDNSKYYDAQNIDGIIQSLIKNYTSLLQKVASSENLRKYITNYAQNSYLAGTTTGLANDKGMADDMKGFRLKDEFGLQDNSTDGSDDMIGLNGSNNTTVDATVSTSSYSGIIIHLSGGSGKDDKVANDTMDKMVKKYVDTYSGIIEGNRIFELFKEAQEKAINKLKAAVNAPDPDKNPMAGLEVYAYGDYGKTKNASNTVNGDLCSVASLMIQIEVEMELLIAKEIAGIS